MRSLAMAGVALFVLTVLVRADEEKVPLDKVPKAVLEAAKKRFPKAEVVEASKETDDGKTVYELELKENGKKIEVTLTAEGTITEIENQIDLKDLPKTVAEAIEAKYPKASLKSIEEIIKVKDGKEVVIVYEVLLVTVDNKEIEVKVAPDGKLKNPEEKQPEKKGEKNEKAGFTDDFSDDKANLTHSGKNPYFILEPGYQMVLEGGKERLVITVLADTKMVDGVECRVIEERETKGDKLVEVSRNYFAISKRTNNVYYFGEDVDIFKDGKEASHEGSWLSGKDGTHFGLMMPGLPLLGARYHQEVAPKIAMDRAEIVSISETVETPAGTFKKCLKTEETTPLEKGEKEYKLYAPGIGLVQEGKLKLVKYGKVDLPKK